MSLTTLPVRQMAALAACGALLACAALLVVALHAKPAGADENVKPQITSVSSQQAAAIPALRAPAALTVPSAARNLAQLPLVAREFAPNPALGRAVADVPGGGSQPWDVIPGNDSICLTSGENNGGTCASLADAAAGKLYIQLIEPPDAKHALPEPGQPTPSTIIGVAPAGARSVSASTESGSTVDGKIVSDGLYSITGTDITTVNLGGDTSLAVPIAVH